MIRVETAKSLRPVLAHEEFIHRIAAQDWTALRQSKILHGQKYPDRVSTSVKLAGWETEATPQI